MPDKAPDPNVLLPVGRLRSTKVGDIPERLRARYYVEDHGRDWRFYVDATVKRPVFEDRGRQLLSRRADPNAIRDMVAIADHRGWRTLDARGSKVFRREAWLAGRAAGLEVRGYRPTERDHQALERLAGARERHGTRSHAPADRERRSPGHPGAMDRLQVAEAVVRARVPEGQARARILSAARARIADWLERGARFEPLGRHSPTPPRGAPHERRR
jgi:hypothetical protein